MEQVDTGAAVAPETVAKLVAWLEPRKDIAVITGAGVSTASGIPDYRDLNGQWKRPKPIQHSDFVQHEATRQRYWARSFVGWQHFQAASPNSSHYALATLERLGRVNTIITQNVDRLHQRAGSRHVIDLHGRLDRVTCLDCGETLTRAAFQKMLESTNRAWNAHLLAVAPDGDADLRDADYRDFQVPPCPRCGGVLKPAVVFYGGALVPTTRAAALAAVAAAKALLVVGSSLMVWSAYSLVREAARLQMPIASINYGHTRADGLLALKCEAECGVALTAVTNALTNTSSNHTHVAVPPTGNGLISEILE